MTVYVLHFAEPIGNPSNPRAMAQHYIGWSPEPESRIRRHISGDGAKIVRYVVEAGIGFEVAATFEGGPELERKLKRRHDTPRWCPVCKQLRQERKEADEVLEQLDWEREHLEAWNRADQIVVDHEQGRHVDEPAEGCFPCHRERRRTAS